MRRIPSIVLSAIAAVLLLPFIYLTSLAVLLSAEGQMLQGDGVVRHVRVAYSAPARAMVCVPIIGRLYYDYLVSCLARLPPPALEVTTVHVELRDSK